MSHGSLEVHATPKKHSIRSTRCIGVMLQFSADTVLTIDAGVQVMAPNGGPNSVKRRMIDVTVLAPSGKILFKKKGVFQDVQVSVPASEMGAYKLWCAHASCFAWSVRILAQQHADHA